MKPLKGKTIVAFSWAEPDFDKNGKVYFSGTANKFGLLEGVVSKPSDDQGYAYFDNLSYYGLIYPGFYTIFSSDAWLFINWGPNRPWIYS